MHIEAVPNRNAVAAILLRESYRGHGRVRKRTLCSLSDRPTAHIEGLRGVLKGGTVIPAEREPLTVVRRLPHGHLAAVLGTARRIGLDRILGPAGNHCRRMERAFRCIKTVDLQLRPMPHWLADRVRAHVFLCMPACPVGWHMRQRLAQWSYGRIWVMAANASASPCPSCRAGWSSLKVPLACQVNGRVTEGQRRDAGKRAELARAVGRPQGVRPLAIARKLATGDRALGFCKAPDRARAAAAIVTSADKGAARYDRAMACLVKERDVLLSFYDFPAGHWDHPPTSNPIESVFAR